MNANQFKCCQCQHEYPLYYRSDRAPNNLCYDCYTNHWELVLKPIALAGGDCTRQEVEMILLSAGYSQRQIAETIGVCSSTIRRHIQRIRKDPSAVLETMRMIGAELERQRTVYQRRRIRVRHYDSQ